MIRSIAPLPAPTTFQDLDCHGWPVCIPEGTHYQSAQLWANTEDARRRYRGTQWYLAGHDPLRDRWSRFLRRNECNKLRPFQAPVLLASTTDAIEVRHYR